MQEYPFGTPKVLLFDLGGVILPWVGIQELAKLAQASPDHILSEIASCPICQAYEVGLCGDDIFARSVIDSFNLSLSVIDFKDRWNSWVQAPYPGTKQSLAYLRQSYKIACLSNTNALHWAYIKNHIILEDFFDFLFASHLINAAKPDPQSYNAVIQGTGVNPSDIWFFDDTQANIDAATSLGMTAFHVNRQVGVIPLLKELNLLPA